MHLSKPGKCGPKNHKQTNMRFWASESCITPVDFSASKSLLSLFSTQCSLEVSRMFGVVLHRLLLCSHPFIIVCIRYIGLLLYSLDVITLTLTEKTSLALLPMILTHSIIVTYFFVIKHFVCVVGKLVCRCKVHLCVIARGHVGCFLQLLPTSFWNRIFQWTYSSLICLSWLTSRAFPTILLSPPPLCWCLLYRCLYFDLTGAAGTLPTEPSLSSLL